MFSYEGADVTWVSQYQYCLWYSRHCLTTHCHEKSLSFSLNVQIFKMTMNDNYHGSCIFKANRQFPDFKRQTGRTVFSEGWVGCVLTPILTVFKLYHGLYSVMERMRKQSVFSLDVFKMPPTAANLKWNAIFIRYSCSNYCPVGIPVQNRSNNLVVVNSV